MSSVTDEDIETAKRLRNPAVNKIVEEFLKLKKPKAKEPLTLRTPKQGDHCRWAYHDLIDHEEKEVVNYISNIKLHVNEATWNRPEPSITATWTVWLSGVLVTGKTSKGTIVKTFLANSEGIVHNQLFPNTSDIQHVLNILQSDQPQPQQQQQH